MTFLNLAWVRTKAIVRRSWFYFSEYFLAPVISFILVVLLYPIIQVIGLYLMFRDRNNKKK